MSVKNQVVPETFNTSQLLEGQPDQGLEFKMRESLVDRNTRTTYTSSDMRCSDFEKNFMDDYLFIPACRMLAEGSNESASSSDVEFGRAFSRSDFSDSFPPGVDPTYGRTLSITKPMEANDRVFPTKEMSVGIIGAGPAGIHMAYELQKKGFTNIVLLEKSNRVGGKSYTISHRDESDTDVHHEMGTCFLHQGYGRIMELVEKFVPDNALVVPTDRDIFIHPKDSTPTALKPYIRKVVNETRRAEQCCTVINSPFPSMLTLFLTIMRYKRFHHKFFGGKLYESWPSTLPPEVSEKKMKSIDMPFGEFMQSNGFGCLLPLIKLGHSMQGYGLTETIPTFYGLWWFTPALCMGLLKVDKRFDKRVLTMMLQKGYNSIWTTMAEKLELDIVFNCEIERITRREQISKKAKSTCDDTTSVESKSPSIHNSMNTYAKEKNVQILTKVYNEEKKTCKTKIYDFDFLIVAAPHGNILPLLEAPTSLEKELITSLQNFTFTTTLYRCDKIPSFKECIAYWPFRLTPNAPVGALVADRHCKMAMNYDSGRDDKRQDRVAYQFNDRKLTGPEEEQLLPELKTNLSRNGARNVSIVKQKVWPYFYHWNRDGVRKRNHYRLLASQGKNATWWIGSCSCFESVLDVVAYNELLANHLIQKSYS
eukprot:g3911.t1